MACIHSRNGILSDAFRIVVGRIDQNADFVNYGFDDVPVGIIELVMLIFSFGLYEAIIMFRELVTYIDLIIINKISVEHR